MTIGSVEVRAVDIGIILLTLLTAIIHIALGQPLFILNGLGYLAFLAALYLPIPVLKRWKRLIRWVFGGYILLTIVLYFVIHAAGSWQEDGLGMVTKLIEVILLLLLIYDALGKTTEEKGSA